jgi:hypothetical protein
MQDPRQSKTNSSKKPYVAPKITNLGRVMDLTLTGGSDPIADSLTGTFKVTP